MSRLRAVATVGLLTLLHLSVSAPGAEEMDHSEGTIRQVILGRAAILPDDLTIAAKDVLEFQNMSAETLTVTFTEPADVLSKVRCHLPRTKGDAAPPWALFTVEGGKLVGTLPPGRFASLCSLAPGDYAYTVQRLAVAGTGTAPLPRKGQVHVK